MLRTEVKNGLRKLGYVASRYDHRRDPFAVRKHFFEMCGINLVFDIGANSGQFAQQLLESGYRGKIVSFEPLSAAFGKLSEAAQQHSDWDAVHCALGHEEGSAEINVAANSWSSSLLAMLPTHLESAPSSAYIATETIQIKTLDALYPSYRSNGSRAFLKIDTQGFTMKVLEGGSQTLKEIPGLQVEMSLVPLYEGEPLIAEVMSFLQGRGFTPIAIFPEFFDDRTGQQLQVNGLFFRL
jgi:FkbM family methyltransferase